VIVRGLATGSVGACNTQSSTDVVHDHIRLGQHQIAAITRSATGIGTRHVQHAGTTCRGETVRRPPRSIQLSSRGGATEMINDGCSNANRQVFGQAPLRKPVATCPAVLASAAGLSGSDSMPRKQSCQPALPLQFRSDLGHVGRGSGSTSSLGRTTLPHAQRPQRHPERAKAIQCICRRSLWPTTLFVGCSAPQLGR
jgi:hypothetical protein